MRDLTNMKFGKLTAISPLKERAKRSIVWKCLCDCGETTNVPSRHLVSGNTKSCGCLQSGGYPPGFNDLYGRARGASRHRGLEFSLSKEQYFEIVTQDCVYCGDHPSNEHTQRDIDIHGDKKEYGTFIYSGIDRVDNTKGYIPGNCVPCCIRCNKAKTDRTLDDFTDWVTRVYEHLKGK